ncbi:MAG: ketoacyl-ACP synthase III [Chlorobi bacterium]|nr:ketoacyl-ACP synthase III [Chlorobiota bacterium]
MNSTKAIITSVGHYVPPDVYDNHYFEEFLDTNDQWIRERTGIIERRFAKDGATSDLAVPAIKMCLDRRGLAPEDIDCIIVATVTPDMFFPSTACVLQEKIGAKNAWGFDLSGACSGYLFALATGAQFIESGTHKNVLVVGADKMSSIIDFEDRNTCILFGDGGGAVLLEPSEEEGYGLLDFDLHIDGAGEPYLHMRGGGSLNPPTQESVANKLHYVFQDGKAVFKEAVIGMADTTERIMKSNNLAPEDVRWLVPHQANLRIIKATADRIELPMENVMVNIDKYGNTTAATLPICLSEWWENGNIAKGDNLILATFGAGYTWGSGWLKWAY